MKKRGLFLVCFSLIFIIGFSGFVLAVDSIAYDSEECGGDCSWEGDMCVCPYGSCPPNCWLNNLGTCGCNEPQEDDYQEDYDEEEYISDWDGTCGDFDCDDLELRSGGLAPDSAFYFVDEFFDGFSGDLENREEKVAEIEEMIYEDKFKEAKEALDQYYVYAENLENEVDPDDLWEAKKSSMTIEKTLYELENEIPEEYKDDFVKEIVIKEGNIRTAAEISSKIKELCIELAELDPVQYSRTCKSDGDAPKWKKDLDKDLTEDQRKEAKDFGKIMSECFETSGRECRCEDISFYDFSLACSKVAPLAVECDDGDESACGMMDEIDMPELPDFLEDIFEDIEDKYGEDKYGMHMPPECVEAGVTSPRECGRIMVKENAPIECRAALLEADVQDEREGRKICDKIMFKKHAPRECIEEGITDFEDCEDFMGDFRGPGGFGPPGQDCMVMENPDDRLKCFEGAMGNMDDHYGIGDKFEDVQGEITWQCKENRIHWPPDCERFMREELPMQERQYEEEKMRMMEEEKMWEVEWDVRTDGRQLCPDGICDEWERNNNGCWEDCGGDYYDSGEEYYPEQNYPSNNPCPDGVCDQWERENNGCWQDCGGGEEYYTEDDYYPPQEYYPDDSYYPPTDYYPDDGSYYPPEGGDYYDGTYPDGSYPPPIGEPYPDGDYYPPQEGDYYPDDGSYYPPEGDYYPDDNYNPDEYYEEPPSDNYVEPPPEDTYTEPPPSEPEPAPEPAPEPEPAPTTGEAIGEAEGNWFTTFFRNLFGF